MSLQSQRFKSVCYDVLMSLDYIYKGMRFKVNGNQIIWLVGGKVQDVWSVEKFNAEDIKTIVIERMINMHFLYKEHFKRL